MIGYVTLGTSNLERATRFYDAVMAELGARSLYANEREVYWGHSPEGPKLAVVLPFDGGAPSAGNGCMIALRARSRQEVGSAHRAALAAGALDEGAVGPRGDGAFFGGYFRDLDGHKICVFVT